MLEVGIWPLMSKYMEVLSSSKISMSRNAAVSSLFFDFEDMVISCGFPIVLRVPSGAIGMGATQTSPSGFTVSLPLDMFSTRPRPQGPSKITPARPAAKTFRDSACPCPTAVHPEVATS